MQTLYATIEQAKNITGKTIKAKCTCGETYAIETDKAIIIVCDSCTEEADCIERFF